LTKHIFELLIVILMNKELSQGSECVSPLSEKLSKLRVEVVTEIDVHVTVHRDKFLIIKPTRCTNFSNLFLEWNSTCFGQFPYLSSGVFYCTHSNGICHTGLL